MYIHPHATLKDQSARVRVYEPAVLRRTYSLTEGKLSTSRLGLQSLHKQVDKFIQLWYIDYLMKFNSIVLTPVPFDIETKVYDSFGKEDIYMFTDEQANKFVCDSASDYYVTDNREEPPQKMYVRDFRKLHSTTSQLY